MNHTHEQIAWLQRKLAAGASEFNLTETTKEGRVDLGTSKDVLDLFYSKDDIDFIFTDLRGLVTTIWILIASVQIVTM